MELSYQEAYSMTRVEARHRLVQTYTATGSIAATARDWHTSRAVVRKWVRRFRTKGLGGLADASRRPHRCPNQTKTSIQELVNELRDDTGYGRKRLAWLLWTSHRVCLSPDTVRHVLRRLGHTGRTRPRKQF